MITLIQGEYEKAKAHYKSGMLKDYFEFHFVYTSANEVFRELDRFIWESRHQKHVSKTNIRDRCLSTLLNGTAMIPMSILKLFVLSKGSCIFGMHFYCTKIMRNKFS